MGNRKHGMRRNWEAPEVMGLGAGNGDYDYDTPQSRRPLNNENLE